MTSVKVVSVHYEKDEDGTVRTVLRFPAWIQLQGDVDALCSHLLEAADCITSYVQVLQEQDALTEDMEGNA